MQNRRRKWHFPLNFRNGIIWTAPFPLNIRNATNWAGAFSKAFSSSEVLIYLFKFFSVKNTVHCTNIQMVMSGHQFMNLKFVHLSKNIPTEHQHLVTVLAYRKYCRRLFKYPLGLAKETISVLRNFVTILKKVVKSPKNNLLQYVPTFWSYSFWNGKENKLAFRNYINYIFTSIYN